MKGTHTLMKTITPQMLGKFSGTRCTSKSAKLVIPVGKLTEPLVFPDDPRTAPDMVGKALQDYGPKPKRGSEGLVFWNYKGQCWQGVVSEVGIILFNEATEKQVEQVIAKIDELTDNGDPTTLTADQIRQVLEFANSIGLGDQYDSYRTYVAEALGRAGQTPTTSDGTEIADYGWYVRTGKDVWEATYLTGNCEFAGPSGSPEKFDDGGVVIRKGDDMRSVQSDVFERTYMAPDGSPLKVTDLPVATV